jgi:hypothetical protein
VLITDCCVWCLLGVALEHTAVKMEPMNTGGTVTDGNNAGIKCEPRDGGDRGVDGNNAGIKSRNGEDEVDGNISSSNTGTDLYIDYYHYKPIIIQRVLNIFRIFYF